MGIIDIIIVAGIAIITYLIIRNVVKKRKEGITSCGCGGGCGGCSGCGAHPHDHEEE